MNIALIFAGGTGTRMNSRSKPKQFLELHGRPIIIYTIELFENHPDIDGIVISCLEDWIPYLELLLKRYSISKVRAVVAGGETGQDSIWNALQCIQQLYPPDSIVLVHDGVRPMITENTITDCIHCVEEYGNAVTVAPATETVVITDDNHTNVSKIVDRSRCLLARAPQCFFLHDLYEAHIEAKKKGRSDYIDSASMMAERGAKLYTVVGPAENIKITTPADYYIFRAIADAREDSQIFGL